MLVYKNGVKLKTYISSFNTNLIPKTILQREEGLERLSEKIENLLTQDSTTRNNTDVGSLLRSLYEVQMLVKQLYPDNKTLMTILNRQDLFKGEHTAAYTKTN